MRRNKEVYFNETLPYRSHNPLNVRYAPKVKWQGQTGRDEQGNCQFSGFSMGYRAAVMILRSYRRRGIKRLGTIIERWAPRTASQTDAYIQSVIDTISPRYSEPYVVARNTVIDLRNRELVIQLLLAMTRKEMNANAAQMHSMRDFAEMGYDLAVSTPGFWE